ncbi:MAG TPA: GNAT family N-acetyltransferase [Thermoproteota archaeon]|nr:GNAT family N-acetyltransferase [Thermoproteota archaeon]
MGSEIRVTDDEDHSHKVEFLADGVSTSWLWINDIEIRVGVSYLKMGGVGGVNTLEEQRMKGYSRRVLERSVNFMTEHDYDISMLYGIPDFYSRWGYASTVPDYKTIVPLRNARRAHGALHARPMTKDDANQVLDVYELTNEGRTGPVRRDRKTWFRFRKGSDWRIMADGTVFEDGSGKIVAYYAADRWPRVMRITEVGALEPLFYENMLKHASEVADEKQAPEIEVYAPLDHPFVSLCKRMGCTITSNYYHDQMGMGRIIDIVSTFERLCPELSKRLRSAGLKGSPPSLSIRTDMGNITLDLSDSDVSVSKKTSAHWIELPQWALMQLILGYRSVSDATADPTIRTEGNVQEVLEVLFPAGYPYLWMADWF